MNLGERITELRKLKKMTQKELAEMLNVSDKVISKWETGKSLPDVEIMLKLSEALGTSISELYECVEKTSVKQPEEYNEERIWHYKKYSIISSSLVVLPAILLLFFILFFDGAFLPYVIQRITLLIFTVICIVLYVLGLLFQVTQFVRLYSYSKNKYYKAEYIRVLKKYGTVFLLCLFLPIIIFIFVVIILNSLY